MRWSRCSSFLALLWFRLPPAAGSASLQVVLGDNCGTLGPGLLAAGQDPDLLVLEATNTYLPELGDTGGFAAHRRQTVRNGSARGRAW